MSAAQLHAYISPCFTWLPEMHIFGNRYVEEAIRAVPGLMESAERCRFAFHLLEAGKEFGLIPCGLGARDTLRLEAAMPLYGHELTDDITPLEAGLDFFVKLGKDRFIGMDAILAKGDPKVIRVGLKITGRGIAREHCDVYSGEEKIGVVTSGTHCPYLNAPVAMAMVPVDYSEVGTKVQVDVRGRRIDAEVVPLPFYKRA